MTIVIGFIFLVVISNVIALGVIAIALCVIIISAAGFPRCNLMPFAGSCAVSLLLLSGMFTFGLVG